MKLKLKDGIVIGALAAAPSCVLAAPTERATEAFRAEHAEVKEHLAHLDQMAGSLAANDAAAQRRTAGFIAKFLKDHILSHAQWEEAHLYPAVDKRTHAGEYPFTGSMRYEHIIVGRSIAELETMAAAESIDATRFARKTDRLLGLIAAHFEEEEEVLLPILDKSTTREALEKELGMDKGAHGH
ncbi:MAG: hemerythrin domain-containing protein [Thermoanaerobaculia bacterium]